MILRFCPAVSHPPRPEGRMCLGSQYWNFTVSISDLREGTKDNVQRWPLPWPITSSTLNLMLFLCSPILFSCCSILIIPTRVSSFILFPYHNASHTAIEILLINDHKHLENHLAKFSDKIKLLIIKLIFKIKNC